MNPIKFHILFLFMVISVWVHSQESMTGKTPEESFSEAQQLAFNDKRDDARDLLMDILHKSPNYHDARILLAKTYSWDADYINARNEFNKVLSQDKMAKDAWIGAINNELYANNFYLALGLSNKSLLYIKQDRDLSLLKAKATSSIGEVPLAIDLLSGHLKTFGQDTVAKALYRELKEQVNVNSLGVSASAEVFDIVYDPMAALKIDYKRMTPFGSIAAHINYGYRFGMEGIQYGLELYPKITNNVNAHLTYSYSQAEIFPQNLIGGEIYLTLPNALEASLGGRYYDFENSTATVLTGSLGMYRGNYYFSFRPYVTPVPNASPSFSGALDVRKYGKTAKNYIGAVVSYGFLPELTQLNINNQLISETVLYLESQRLNLIYQFPSKNLQNLWKLQAGVLRQELIFDPERFVWSVSAGINYRFMF
ncbi:YaiO family outer membrane beta-barrel protein [Sediminicola sp. 1XM1-17]|uniref:YaiO family outer membrane beta-barrel protein n=1 Tax=Sediminicola sp. 1XM1-17 TaxID=3127702 RepID=UPI003076DD43